MAEGWREVELDEQLYLLRQLPEGRIELFSTDHETELTAWRLTGVVPPSIAVVFAHLVEQGLPEQDLEQVLDDLGRFSRYGMDEDEMLEHASPAVMAGLFARDMFRAGIVLSPRCPALLLEWVSHLPHIADLAAGNPALPLHLMREWATVDADRKASLAINPALPLELQRQLASDSDPEIRAQVVTSRYTAPELLEEVANDPLESADIRELARAGLRRRSQLSL